MILNQNKKELEDLLNKYNLTLDEKEELLDVIYEIFLHDEFQRRMTSEFKHHDEITLGHHILQDTIVTYLLSKKYEKINKNGNFELETALKIAMFHDLYELPWQNNPAADVDLFLNKHGFRHPIEAIINANSWYPEMFEIKQDAEKIIDGVVHHMYPLPVTSFVDSGKNDLELKNFDKVSGMSELSKSILEASSNRGKIGRVSLARSKYPEGRIMSDADKIVSMTNFNNVNGLMALLTGHNKNLENGGKHK